MSADAAPTPAATTPAATPLHHDAGLRALAWAAALTLGLHLLPMLLPDWGLWRLQWPLKMISSLVHELGHGLTAALLGGDFENLRLWTDGSGVAGYRGDFSALALATIAGGGLLGPPFAAVSLLLAGRGGRGARGVLAGFALLLGAVVLLWAANLFTVLFCVALATPLVWLAWRGSAAACQVACVFVALQLGLASFSRADYLFMAHADTGDGLLPSDVAQIAEAMWLPYWFWGALIALASLLLLGFGAWRFLRALA